MPIKSWIYNELLILHFKVENKGESAQSIYLQTTFLLKNVNKKIPNISE